VIATVGLIRGLGCYPVKYVKSYAALQSLEEIWRDDREVFFSCGVMMLLGVAMFQCGGVVSFVVGSLN
jgi:hypothetical protein